MKVFITGATGYVGGAVAAELRRAGHEVTALVRAGRATPALMQARVNLLEGDLSNILEHRVLDVIEKHQTYIHCAQAKTPDMVELDEAAIEAFLRFRDGGRYFLFTSGVWTLGNTGATVVDDEATPPNPIPAVAWRTRHEEFVLEAVRDDFGSAVIRPGCVYGRGQSLLRSWFAAVADGHPIEIVGDGNNRWAMVNVADLAELYRLAIEKRHNGVIHGTDDSRETLNEMARAVIDAHGKDTGIVHIPVDEARKAMGAFTDALVIDQKVASLGTRQQLGWNPRRTFVNSVAEQWKEWKA